MSRLLKPSTSRSSSAGHGSDGGYGRPPAQHRFKPGQSGNPKGRPRGRKNEATIWHDRLYRKVSIRENGTLHKIPVLEAILLRIIESALKGDTKSAAFILGRLQGLESGQPPANHLSDDDRTILEAYAKTILAQSRKTR
jgi:hypothetical protein